MEVRSIHVTIAIRRSSRLRQRCRSSLFLIEQAVGTFGRLDVAFNNAGILGYTGDPADETADSYDRVNAVNLRGVWTCMKHELLHMRVIGRHLLQVSTGQAVAP